MKNRLLKMGAALCAGLMLLTGGVTLAEEKRLGDYIYVPAMTAAGSVGTLSLRVEGLALEGANDEPVLVESLSGAEFGVYVFSEDGELKPWANPLYPSEQMRIRTGEGMTSFSLPQGVEFYLRQEGAPQGYLFDPNQLIRVEGDEIVVTNSMAGELILRAQDSLGNPIVGVTLEAVGENGEFFTVVTDENGEGMICSEEAGMFTVREASLPQGAFDAIRVLVNGQEVADAQARVDLSSRTRLTFEHPASGSVALSIHLTDVDQNAETVTTPLAGVKMEIIGEKTQTVVTDETGSADISLLEGLYTVRFSYEGEEELILSHTEGQTIVKSGAQTKIDLTASRLYGRIAVTGVCEKDTQGGSISFENVQTGAVYGPYAFDAESDVVSDVLPVGEYRIADLIAPDDTQVGGVTVEGISQSVDSAVLRVEPGIAARMDVDFLTMKKQTFSLYTQQIDDKGEIAEAMIPGVVDLTLISEDGTQIADVTAENGLVQIEALNGVYMLRMDEREADIKGVSALSQPFSLPGQSEAIVFGASGTRLILMSVDENGESVYGATYSVLDSTGMEIVATTDSDAQAVTPVLTAGELRVESIVSPENHDEAQVMTVTSKAGEATVVQVVHPSYGVAEISVQVQRLDERGAPALSALPGVRVYVYSVGQDGTTLVDTGLELVSSEDGAAFAQLEPGRYVAQVDVDDLPEGYSEGEAVSFTVENTQRTQGKLVCMDAAGGVRAQLVGGVLSDEQMAQVRFELVDEDGNATGLVLTEGGFYAGGLAAGSYTLRQTQIPQGYTLAKEIHVEVTGGAAAQISVPLEEYAVLTVSKSGITFNDRMQTYIVPLSGQYGVYTMEDGEMTPYPSADEQMTVWANVTPEQIAQGRIAKLRLPADMDGTTYYVKEIGSAAGFAPDETYHEVTLAAGEETGLSCTVSSDRGFFTFDQADAATGEHVPGGEYELVDNATGEVMLSFTLGQESYRNAMAVPVGDYTLRQISAGEGYAMSGQPECAVYIEPYLTQGGMVTHAVMTSARIPEDAFLDVIADLYAAGQEGLTLVMVEGSALDAGETLRMPQMTIDVRSEGGERTDVSTVVLSGVTDAQGGSYVARVEYCLEGGGWQPSDARMTGELTAPVSVSLMDVEDDISAVRITYINAATGEEMAGEGFNFGQISLCAEVSEQGEAAMMASTSFTGDYVYRTQQDGETHLLERSVSRELRFAAQGSGEFETVSAGRDGRITGVVFFDENADGVLSASENARYAGMIVSLMTPSMELVSTCRTDGNGRYEFSGLSGGEYMLQFEAGEKLVFSSGDGYSEHVISGVKDKAYGVSGTLRFDGDHTDYIVNAGCIYAAHAGGSIVEKTPDGTLRGYEGLNIDVMPVNGSQDEPIVVMTDDSGAYRLSRLLPGEYEVIIALPQGYLSADAQDGVIRRQMTIGQGEDLNLGEFTLARKASVSGGVYVDVDGDGLFAQGAEAIGNAKVTLLRHQDGHTEEVAETTTDANGFYAFDNLFDGEYSVLFELNGEWTFTRFGGDSKVYGAVSSSGSTQSFTLLPDAQMDDMNAGVTLPAQLEVFVFADEHADGQKGAYDVGLADVTVTLIRQENGQDAEQISLTTGRDGVALFDGLAPGEYVIAYQMPGIYRATKQVESASYPTSCVPQTTLSVGRSEPFTLTMGEGGTRKYIGAMLSGLISGTVYYDNDADARIGEDEPACPNVLVELLNAAGEVLDTRYSGENGEYVFEGLAPGRYSVRFSAQAECGFSGSERSMTRGGVKKSDEPVSTTRSLSVSTGGKLTTVHAGVVLLASVQGTLFIDSNADRVMDETESRLSGVSVHLMNGTARNILMSTETDKEGSFSFDRVTPGTYLIRVDSPDGYVFSGTMDGSPLPLSDIRDGRGYSAAFELLGGAHAQGIGYGLLTQGTISGHIWVDEDYDGMAGEKESGLRGATVTLTDLDGNEIGSKATIRSGEFTFDGLMPGEYALSVSLTDGYVFTAAGGDSLMDRIDESSASLYLGELPMGGAMTDLKIGAIRPASVGGVVWRDENNDGRRLDGDAGVSGVTVTLTTISGADSGKTVTTTTDETGSYRFDHVMPGDVKLRFDVAQGYAFAQKASGTRRVSCVPMTDALSAESDVFTIASGNAIGDKDVGVLPVGTISGSVWEDAIYDGKAQGDENGIAGARVALLDAASGEEISSAQTDENGVYEIGFVRPGEYMLSFELPNGMIFTCEGEGEIAMVDASYARTQRFAIALGQSRSGVSAGAIVPAGVSGRVSVDWNENGVCEEDEPGLEHAVITVMQGGTVVTSTKTLDDGSFSIDTLRPGSYRIRMALPQDALFAKGAALSLASADAQEGETGEYTLEMGQKVEIPSAPAVLTASVSGRAWLDANTDGRMDGNEQPMTDVTAELLDENGSVIAATSVDGNGEYAFKLLRSGTYAVRFTLGSGVLFADQTGEAGGSSVPVTDGSVGKTSAFTVSQEDVISDLNVGGILPGSIGDTVFLDVNGNGLMDYREPQLAGAQLMLMRVESDGTLTQAGLAVSDEYGYYAFDDLRPGSYVVRAVLQEGDVLTKHFGAPLGEIDSDVNPETGDTDEIFLVSGQTLRNIDIGFVKCER